MAKRQTLAQLEALVSNYSAIPFAQYTELSTLNNMSDELSAIETEVSNRHNNAGSRLYSLRYQNLLMEIEETMARLSTHIYNVEHDIRTGNCCICNHAVSTANVPSKDAFSQCGDCGRVTCGEHREESSAERCTECAAKHAQYLKTLLEPVIELARLADIADEIERYVIGWAPSLSGQLASKERALELLTQLKQGLVDYGSEPTC